MARIVFLRYASRPKRVKPRPAAICANHNHPEQRWAAAGEKLLLSNLGIVSVRHTGLSENQDNFLLSISALFSHSILIPSLSPNPSRGAKIAEVLSRPLALDRDQNVESNRKPPLPAIDPKSVVVMDSEILNYLVFCFFVIPVCSACLLFLIWTYGVLD
ncbi:MAG TPA: hypothetical protein VHV54_16430 [Candidatus Binatia bacterium]|nr:hypothetical protein [Candidatus Binatia bacterium]